MFQSFFSDYLVKLQESNQQWWQDFEQGKAAVNTPLNHAMKKISIDDTTQFLENAANQPATMLHIQIQWWEKQLQIWQNITLATNSEEIVAPEKDDKRFQDKGWQDEVLYNFIKQSYLLFSRTLLETIDAVDGLDKKAKERLTFFSRQVINAMSPSNFIGTNPELFRLTLEKNGKNLIQGLKQFQEDLESSSDILKIRMTNNDAFRIGEDIASTPGDVVYQNELFELIQYRPMTKKVNAIPLLIVPPFVNKYYILDLRENNSMMRWLVEQGHTVFIMSWRNPGIEQKNVEFSDYVTEGVVKAVSAIEDITGQSQINAAGYCIGGTLLASTVAYYAAKRMKTRIKSATFLTTILDFAQPGEVGIYINENIISAIETQNNERGYMDGRSLNVTFNLLRENNLYWNYYIDNYLKGNSPVNFDLLYWNSDSINITAATHNFMLRELYLNNRLVKEKGVKIGGVWIDLNKIKIPTYFISTKEDHIALWQGTYCGALNLNGSKTFVLGESGHIGGIVNHPSKNKYGFWINPELCESAEQWLNAAKHNTGSWWPHWNKWLKTYCPKEQIEPCSQGSENFPVLFIAPGKYVKQRLPFEMKETKVAQTKTNV
ncbi:class I poly(R)-hydroxyalkanoic acid synthase [Candidatus Enterovibrio altilux]|uniref:Polyhydroxyalkanoic acid synthase n=1 Tax=Candidatus Enterovibrio altilux TaxID=1927128 RepID=A0A291B9V0_9GAMM|nr:class I poly(R)-hydroxyalkanoic acid synthase [Candidatus Enterovibrio luxaltus]ATF09761.1 Polyhydroxyalkanoic acid synthase [Candidatus Enterovibrio luxaltus]